MDTSTSPPVTGWPIPATPTSDPAPQLLDETTHLRLSQASLGLSPLALAVAQIDWALHLSASPGAQLRLAQHGLQLAREYAQGLGGAVAVETAQAATDSRFGDEDWSRWPYRAWRDGFKAWESWWSEAANVPGVSPHHRHLVRFFSRQGLDAVAPSNWAATNPEVMREAWNTLGRSWLQGLQHFTTDWLDWQRARLPQMAPAPPPLPYAVGTDVAVTPGKVVYRNHLIELIQYQASTRTVRPEPLLIVPSCIMKYYILDLSPHNSMVRYLVGQGYTVFMISWRNPDASDRELGLADYLEQGVMQAMDAVQSLSRAPRIHALGYCLGGTLLSIVAAAAGRSAAQKAAANGRLRARLRSLPVLASVTLLAAQTDFSEPGELGVFIDEDQVRLLRAQMARTGFLSGRQMADSFKFLNSRDLVWSRSTRRYLLGKDEVGNDMMSWNADVTRLPERMHTEYLTSLFLRNDLAAGRFRIDATGVALNDIRSPLLVVATLRDHVSPWRSVYKIHLLTDTQTAFILAAGGHNAGIVSEPGHPHRSYQIGHVEAGHGWTEPEEWLRCAPRHEGSWWPALAQWLGRHSGAPVAAPARPVRALGDAPGEYVHVRYAD